MCTGPAFPGPIKWSALQPKNHCPRPDAHLPSTEVGVAPISPSLRCGSKAGGVLKSRIVVVRRLRGCGGDWKLKLLRNSQLPPKPSSTSEWWPEMDPICPICGAQNFEKIGTRHHQKPARASNRWSFPRPLIMEPSQLRVAASPTLARNGSSSLCG